MKSAEIVRYLRENFCSPTTTKAAALIIELESKLKAAEEKLALSVPFEVMCGSCKFHCDKDGCCSHINGHLSATPDNCPLEPNADYPLAEKET
jgi:hypothetical protein